MDGQATRAAATAGAEAAAPRHVGAPAVFSGVVTRWPHRDPSALALGPTWMACVLAVVGGLGLDSAFAPLGWWPVAVPASGLVVAALVGRRARVGLFVGFVAGLAEFVPLLWWLHTVTPLAWIVLAIAESAYLAGFGAGVSVVAGQLPGWPLWTAALWVSEELVRARWPLGGFTWGRLAFSQPDTPFTGFASLGGAPLVTFAVGLCGALLAAAWFALRRAPARWHGPWRPRPLQVSGALIAAAVIPVLGAAVPRPTSGSAVQVGVVQGNVPHPGTHFLGRAEQVLDNHAAESAAFVRDIAAGTLPKPQLVIWPENSSDDDPFHDTQAYSTIQSAVRALGVPTLVGVVLDGPGDRVRNTGIVWDPVTGPGAQYVKRHLVPFGEYIPFRSLVNHLTSLTSLVPQNFAPGHTPGVLQVGPARIGDVMCFEVAFDDQVRDAVTHGGQLIVVQTNNATYMHTPETRQQLAMSQLRAVEHGRAVVVAATSGISAVISPNGHVVTKTAEMTPAILDESVPLRTQETVADHLGAGPEWWLGILGLLAVGVGIVIRLAARRPNSHHEEHAA